MERKILSSLVLLSFLMYAFLAVQVQAQTPATIAVTKTVNPTDVCLASSSEYLTEWFEVTIEVTGYGSDSSDAPSSVGVYEITQEYIIDEQSFSITPSHIDEVLGKTQITWGDIGNIAGVGDGVDPLTASETFTVSFIARCNIIGTNVPVDVPVEHDPPLYFEPAVGYIVPASNQTPIYIPIPQAWINVTECVQERDIEAFDQCVIPDTVEPGDLVDIQVSVRNNGNTRETFNVTCYYDSVEIGTELLYSMPPGASMVVHFTLDTTGIPFDEYKIKAWADSSEDVIEVDEQNNWCTSKTSLFVVPELPLGTVLAAASMFAAFGGYIKFKRIRK